MKGSLRQPPLPPQPTGENHFKAKRETWVLSFTVILLCSVKGSERC